MIEVAKELSRIVEQASAELRQVAPANARQRPAADKWSVQEILGHLIDSAANNHQRFVRAQDVDVLAFPKYEQNTWVARQGYQDSPWPQLIDLWRSYNLHLAHVISRIPAEKLSVECRIEPYEPVTLQFLAEDYVVHLEHHLRTIRQLIK